MAADRVIETDAPARMDRLPWSSWHRRMILALGTSWLLDGLEVTLAGSLAGILQSRQTLGLSDAEVSGGATSYLAGAVLGAILFGYLTDRLGRRRLFLVTLAVYASATAATAFSWNFWSFGLFRFVTGMGIGGEYAAINSAVDELIPSNVRGSVDLIVNATFWIGAAFGSLATLFLLNGHWAGPNIRWRIAFGVGAALSMGVLYLRLSVPESPRWLMLRGREEEAGKIVQDIEEQVSQTEGTLPEPEGKKLKLHVRSHTPWPEVVRNMAKDNRQRSLLGLALMAAQSFFYNSVFFTYGLVLNKFYKTGANELPLHLLPFALGNFCGPLILGRFFDSIGRKPMIIATFGIPGALLAALVVPFGKGMLSGPMLDGCFTVIFFVASSAASASYLTVSEIFPLEIRAFAIAVFYAAGTLIGGVGSPLLFGVLISTGSRWNVGFGYLLGSGLMIVAAITEWRIGVEAARKSLESISEPLQSR